MTRAMFWANLSPHLVPVRSVISLPPTKTKKTKFKFGEPMIRGTWNFNEPLVPVNIPALMIKMCSERGIKPERLLTNTGISPNTLKDPSARLSYQQTIPLIENFLRHYPSDNPGMDLGKALNINQFGMLGYAVLSCSSLMEALKLCHKYRMLVEPALNFEIHDRGDAIAIPMTSYIPDPKLHQMVCNIFSVSFIQISKFLTGRKDTRPLEMRFNYSQPKNIEKHFQYCDCLVLFDQPRTEIIVSKAVLDQPLLLADQVTASMAEAQCSELLSRFGTREILIVKVRRIILQIPGVFPSVEDVADQLAISTRTLGRSLRDSGTSYQKILDDIRKEMSIEYLCSSRLPVEEIATLTGYSDPSNFRKAFRRWTGRTPSSYRIIN